MLDVCSKYASAYIYCTISIFNWEMSIGDAFAFWYHLCYLKNIKSTHGGLLLSVKLYDEVCNFTKCNTRPWVFYTFLKLYKWSQVAQSITYVLTPWLYTSVMRRNNKFQLQYLTQSHSQFFHAILKWHKIYENLVETNMMLQKIAPILPIAILLKS